MSETVAFQWVEVEGFRGFRHRQRVLLDASAVLIVGPNGTGKTSFFDAVQWLLVGSLQRLERWRVRKNDEHIVNRYRGLDPAVVEAELEIGGTRVRLRRQGRYDSGFLEWHTDDESLRGEDAERRLEEALTARPGQDIRRLLMTSALLQQDVVREVLEHKPAERYEQLAALLGLDELGAFAAAVRNRADRLAVAGKTARQALEKEEDQATNLRDRIAGLENDMRLAEDVRVARGRIAARVEALEPTVRVSPLPATSADAALLQQAARAAGEQLAGLVRAARDLADRRAVVDVPSPDAIEQLEQTAASAGQRVHEAKAAADAAEASLDEALGRSSKLQALAVHALDLLGPECPVCGKDIDEHDVRDRLHQRLDAQSDQELTVAASASETARLGLGLAQKELDQAKKQLAPALAARQQAQQLERDEELWRQVCATFDLPDGAPLEISVLSAIKAGDLGTADSVLGALRAVWTAAADLAAVLRTDTSDTRLTELRAQLRRAEELIETLKARVRLVSAQEEKGKLLQRATTRAVTAVNGKRFKRLAPTVQDIFGRLDPHPSFKTLDFNLDVYREKGIASPVARDETESVDADPLLVFSSSQANVTALSYFLALGWAAGREALPFVLLDDPLQSMDDVNVLGFADLCRHIRRQRQLVVSTHERRLASLLERKLAPRSNSERTRVIEFTAWTRDGPEIEQRLVEPQLAEGRQRSVVPLTAT
jgi:DNA repair exonuclease SbcCD ATPase subunit